MQAFLQQLPALLGVIVGVFATWATTSTMERARWRRSQAVRWDGLSLTAYAEYAHAVKKVSSIALRVAAHHGIHPYIGALPPEEGLPALASAEEERTIKWESVLLLGTDTTVVAARAWHESVERLQRIASGADAGMTWPEAIAAVSTARRRFYEAAKADIGITIGASPETYEWQMTKVVPVGGETAKND